MDLEIREKSQKKQLNFIIISGIVFIFTLYAIDQWLEVAYAIKCAIKVIMLILIMVGYYCLFGVNIVRDSIVNFKNSGRKTCYKSFRQRKFFAMGLGLILLVGFPIVFNILEPYIDVNNIVSDFENKYMITSKNLIFYGAYLCLVNALFEELFFRGFLFLEFLKFLKRPTAYILSSLGFAIYHMANIEGWFNIAVMLFVLVGLTIGGLIFNFLDEKGKTFLNSYFVHFCADMGIVMVGFMMM